MVKQQYGRVVNIASIAARQPRPMAVMYSAAKAGVVAITRSLAVAMAPYNIRVNCIAPALIETELLRQNTPELLGPILKQTTLGRYCQPEEIAAAVLFFASDEASYIVGQSLHVDGGNCML
jgi:3-oxoacyl-[acyl-carrier protein] reductase